MPGLLFMGDAATNAHRQTAGEGPGLTHGRSRPRYLDEVFLDAVDAVVLAALERIGDDPDARYRFFRRLLAAAEEEAGGRSLS